MSSMHDTYKLAKKIRDEVTGTYSGYGYYSTFVRTDEAAEIAAAVLPIIAEEVRKAKAEAWEECAAKIEMQGTVQIPDNPYKEQE
ncbi:hypothetical protein HMPREF1484_00235 [Dermabacter sp. HFH0086]|uniref:hypothetical protein n=1 Tax=Dermabacter TaxID=36739 RepID=UPI000353572A|nr:MULTISPECIES: hypothetical protein [Dermabacter]EPH17550.1 hypothetical protein HMPREF1484_00235 [Dermabacter sp. HFH0086]